jgi:putative endonuclease
MKRKSLGNLGENLALKYLQKNKGYRFVARNFRSKFGEIDLIFLDKKILVFVEVKTRFSESFGNPEEAVTPWKINAIIKTAQYFKLKNPKLPDSLRIDVVALDLDPQNEKLLNLKHFENVTL